LKGPGAVNVACRVHVPPLRVKTTIPVPLSTSAVLPSPDNATGPDATSLPPLVSGATPCWLQPFGPPRTNTQEDPALALSALPLQRAVLPSPEIAT